MRVKSITLVVAFILLFALIGGGIGCSEESASEYMMKSIPDNIANYQYCDMKILRDDEDLKDLYDGLGHMYEDGLDTYGISFDDVNYIADCESSDWGDLTLFKGNFNLEDVRNTLTISNYSETNYCEEEVWLGDGGDTMIALLENMVVIGDEELVRHCVDVIKGKKDSLSDSSNAKDLMGKMSGGLITYYQTHRTGEGVGLGGSYEIDNYKAYGASIMKKNEDAVRMTMVFEFDDADEAENSLDEIKEMFEEDSEEVIYYNNFIVKQDSRFVISSGEANIEDMLYSDS